MSNFWQTIVLAVLPVLVAGRVAWTRSSRLRRTIDANLGLLDRLPADHPNRSTLEDHNGELLDLLIRRQQRRFGPFTPAGVSFGALAGVASVALVFACFSALLAGGVIPSVPASDPPTPGDQWAAAAFFLFMAAGLALFAVITARRQLREHPAQSERDTGASSTQPQPTEVC